MINPVLAAFLAGLCVFAATSLGASFVFLSGSLCGPSLMDFVYGGSSGVMLAAVFWGLLGPSVDLAKPLGSIAWLPPTVGFIIGVAIIKLFDFLMPESIMSSPAIKFCFGDISSEAASLEHLHEDFHSHQDDPNHFHHHNDHQYNSKANNEPNDTDMRQQDRSKYPIEPPIPERRNISVSTDSEIVSDIDMENSNSLSNLSASPDSTSIELDSALESSTPPSQVPHPMSRKSLLILTFALTLHHIPEGVALGFAFGGSGGEYSVKEALLLAIALAIQACPEGTAISIPLHRGGVSKWKAFLFGALSGSVEVLGAVPGAAFALISKSILPYCLAIAGGAMMYVVLSELLPNSFRTKSKWGAWGALAGFALMLVLNSGLATF